MRPYYLVAVLFLIFSCKGEVDYSARTINYDRDACIVCGMGLTDQRYNLHAINKYGEVRWYDDVGCLVNDMKSGSWKKWDGETATIWIGDFNKKNEPSNWIDARKAHYVYGMDTPMGFGYGAQAANPEGEHFDFKTTIQRIKDGKSKNREKK